MDLYKIGILSEEKVKTFFQAEYATAKARFMDEDLPIPWIRLNVTKEIGGVEIMLPLASCAGKRTDGLFISDDGQGGRKVLNMICQGGEKHLPDLVRRLQEAGGLEKVTQSEKSTRSSDWGAVLLAVDADLSKIKVSDAFKIGANKERAGLKDDASQVSVAVPGPLAKYLQLTARQLVGAGVAVGKAYGKEAEAALIWLVSQEGQVAYTRQKNGDGDGDGVPNNEDNPNT